MSLEWGLKKKLAYLGVLFFLVFISILFLLIPHLNKPPTCFDGKQNGDESGVDCGGSCAKVCQNEALGLVSLWARAFNVRDNNYNIMVFVENQNTEAGIPFIGYEIRVYDDNNIFLGRREGGTFINSNDRSVIFEPGFDFGNRIPVRIDFRFITPTNWIRIDRAQRNALSIDVKDRILSNQLESPRLEAIVVNNTLNDLKDLDVYVILYGENQNVINVGKTYITYLPRYSEQKIFFTWPKPITEPVKRIDVIPQVNIFELI